MNFCPILPTGFNLLSESLFHRNFLLNNLLRLLLWSRQTNTINFGTELPLAQGIKFDVFDY